ncbi:sodium-coupled monocarboxylate transporter 1 isoform X2 [Cherax quadricarinatus]|uniref:sodium-coupled monocarboxylate transporter 1 isoform X2 n=1 Tax=Cherax quadricarinatus TaxID=27406 RepID=UPI00387E7889
MNTTDNPNISEATFTPVDYTVLSLMLVASAGIGVVSAIRSRGKASTQEYLLGGRNMSPLPVAISLLGGWISAISFVEIYFFGTQLTTILLGTVPGSLFAGYIILPIFYKLKIVSINEYLELRFGSKLLRKLATTSLVLFTLTYLALSVYAPALIMSSVTQLSTWVSTLIIGSVCTFYITVGGVRAVVYTDVLQTLIMFGGVLLVVIVCSIDLGGIGNVWTIAERGGRIQFFDFNTSPYERHTFWSTVMLGFYQGATTLTLVQQSYQRLASVSTLQTSQRLIIGFVVGLFTLWIVLYLSGLVAYATYRDCDPLTSGRIQKPDQILTFLVTDKLRYMTGMAGLFVAAVYGCVLSTHSSCGNSMACLVWEDFIKHHKYFSGLSDAKATNVVKLLSAALGLVAMCLSWILDKLGSVYVVSTSLNSALSGPLSGVFIAGICTPWVNTEGAIVGFITSLTFSLWMVIGKLYRGGGSPARLSLSTEGCPENLMNLANTTVSHSIISDTSLTDAVYVNFTENDLLMSNTSSIQRLDSNTIYEISYCYTGIIGIMITVVVGSLVSLCTGADNPGDEKEVVNPMCGRAYKRLFQFLRKSKTHTLTQDQTQT